MIAALPVPCSVVGRVLPWLSLFGNGDDVANGHQLTKNGKRLPIRVASSLFRQFVCEEGCLVCCAVLSPSLDYIPVEEAWGKNPRQHDFTARTVNLNGVDYTIMSNLSKKSHRDHPKREDPNVLSKYCTFLGPVRNGNPGCTLWGTGSPLACASAYNMRVTEHRDHIQITKQGMARAWRYDPAPECHFDNVPVSEMDLETNILLLNRFIEWAEYFNMPASIERISELVNDLREVLRTGNVPLQIVVL